MTSCKEKFLLTRELMDYAKKSNGTIFGGSIPSYFKKLYFTNAYKRTLIKNNDLDHFDEYYGDAEYDPETFTGRNNVIRDIDVFFKNEDDVETYMKEIYKIPGVFQIVESDRTLHYKRHVLFDKNFKLKKIVVKYLYDHSFCRKGKQITVPIDIVTNRPESEYNFSPVAFMQELTVKQLMWDTSGIYSALTKKISGKNNLTRSLEILDDFNANVCFISEETKMMRNEFRNLLPDTYDSYPYDYSNSNRIVSVCILERIIESRIMVISRLISYHGVHTVVNSPISFEEKGSCGICFTENEGHGILRWKTKQNNSQSYCKKCIFKYLRSFSTVSGYHTHDEYEPDYFHDDPILTKREWKYLTTKQIHLIENTFVCPVGNKADFSCSSSSSSA
jgi:hypothetical protein